MDNEAILYTTMAFLLMCAFCRILFLIRGADYSDLFSKDKPKEKEAPKAWASSAPTDIEVGKKAVS